MILKPGLRKRSNFPSLSTTTTSEVETHTQQGQHMVMSSVVLLVVCCSVGRIAGGEQDDDRCSPRQQFFRLDLVGLDFLRTLGPKRRVKLGELPPLN